MINTFQLYILRHKHAHSTLITITILSGIKLTNKDEALLTYNVETKFFSISNASTGANRKACLSIKKSFS